MMHLLLMIIGVFGGCFQWLAAKINHGCVRFPLLWLHWLHLKKWIAHGKFMNNGCRRDSTIWVMSRVPKHMQPMAKSTNGIHLVFT
jgi:hypothetical protein